MKAENKQNNFRNKIKRKQIAEKEKKELLEKLQVREEEKILEAAFNLYLKRENEERELKTGRGKK